MKTLLALIALGLAAALINGAAADKPCCHKPLAADAPLPDKSLYQVTSAWTNDAGAQIKLASFRGEPRVVTMFFAKCEFACPLLVSDMKRIEEALPENARKHVGFILISFDTERDTTAALANFRRKHSLGENWTLLRGSPDDVLEIAALLGVKYRKDGRGQFAHSNLVTLLNGEGEVVTQQAGLNQPGTELARAAERLLPPK